MKSRGNRADVVIATKVSQHPEYQGLTAANIKAAADASPARLDTDCIDLYYTHSDQPDVPVEEIITALDDLVKAGKVRAIAASNTTPERLQASLDFSAAEGLARYVALQSHYNLVSRDTYEGPLQAVATDTGLSAVPYFALAKGFLTGKYRPGTTVDSPRAAGAGAYLETPAGTRVLTAFDEIAASRGSSRPSTRSPRHAVPPTPPSPSPGSPPSRPSPRRSPPRARSTNSPPSSPSPTSPSPPRS